MSEYMEYLRLAEDTGYEDPKVLLIGVLESFLSEEQISRAYEIAKLGVSMAMPGESESGK